MISRVVSLFVLFVALVLATSGCNSLPKMSGNIAVDVVDSSGYPQGYCTVQIALATANTSLRQDTTDDNGHVFFGKLDPGEYKVYILNANEQEFTIIDDEVHKLGSGRTLNLTIKVDRNQLKEKTLTK
jgi:hypothetical protein